ncbi:MAG: PAS domain S-box protein [Methylococcaceae bacterium]
MLDINRLMPHGVCFEWRPELLLAHGLSDGLTTLAYFSIPVLILHIIHQRPILKVGGVYQVFVLFILACGIGHVLDVWTIWHPDYYLQAVSKAFTAIISIIAVYKLWTLIPLLERIPSMDEYEARNRALQEEIIAHIATEENLRQQKLMTDQLQQTLNEYALVSVTDGEVSILYANEHFCKVSGYTAEELLGQNHRIVNSGYHDEDFFKNLWASISSGSTWRGEICNLKKNGTTYWVDAMIRPMNNENGIPYRYISVRREITNEMLNRDSLTRGKHEAEIMVRQILENLPAYASIKDENGTMVYANSLACSLFGKTQEEISGHNDLEFFEPGFGNAIRDSEIKVLRDGVAITVEESVQVPGKQEIRHVVAAKVPLHREDGSIKGLLVIANDITEQKQNELRIEELAHFNQSILDSLNAKVCVINATGSLLAVNRAWTESPDMFKLEDGHNYLDVCDAAPVSDLVAHQVAKGLRQIINGQIIHFALEYPCELCGQSVRVGVDDADPNDWYLLDATRFPGEPLRIVVSHTNITERMRLGQQLKSKEQLLTTILNNMGASVYMKTPELQYLYVNPQCAALYGHASESMLGMRDEDIVCEATAKELGKLDKLVMGSAEKVEGMETFKRTDDSAERYLWSIKMPLRDECNTITALLGISTDITDRKRLEDEHLHTMERSTRVKTEFMANISHEIRTPMNSVLGVTELLRDTTLDGEQSHYLDILQFSCQHVLCLINDMLELSKIEAGHWIMENRPFKLSDMLSAVLKSLIPLADNKGLKLIQDVSTQIPDHYQGSPLRIGQIITNLVGNAIKFTRSGSITVTIKESENAHPDLERDQIVLHFAVRDTGIGIPQEHQDRIFKAFEQIESGNDLQVQGTGLGLTISSSLVFLMGGQLKVISTEGVGSTFYFDLPLQKGNPSESDQKVQSSGAISLKGKKILLVEDNEINRELVEARLKKLECIIYSAEHGKKALEILHQERFDLILMDMRMPIMDGPTATRLFRLEERESGWSYTPILALTANAHEEDVRTCLESGMDGHIGKPFTVDMLLEGIAAVYRKLDGHNEKNKSMALSTTLSTAAVLDVAAALDMVANDEDLLYTIETKFVARYPELLAQIRTAVETANCELGRDAAHTLKGNAGYLCAHELRQCAALLEQLFRDEQIEAAKATMATLEQALSRVAQAIEDHIMVRRNVSLQPPTMPE